MLHMFSGEGNTKSQRRVMSAVAIFLGFVTVAPLIISGQDLYHWANNPKGLNLPAGFALLIPVVFDIAAASCIGMNIIGAVWRSERAGIFGLMTWVFAGASAFAQYRSGMSSLEEGIALDAYWAFPLVAILGPTLLHLVLNKIRKWTKEDAGIIKRGAAGFGTRWIPGVAFKETLRAWAVSHREGITQWEAAVTLVREQDALRSLSGKTGRFLGRKTYQANEAVFAYAADALPKADPYTVRKWLSARGILVTGEVKINGKSERKPAQVIPVEVVEAPVSRDVVEASVDMVVEKPRAEKPRAEKPRAEKPKATKSVSMDVETINSKLPGWQEREVVPSARKIARAFGYSSPSSGLKIRKYMLTILEESSND